MWIFSIRIFQLRLSCANYYFILYIYLLLTNEVAKTFFFKFKLELVIATIFQVLQPFTPFIPLGIGKTQHRGQIWIKNWTMWIPYHLENCTTYLRKIWPFLAIKWPACSVSRLKLTKNNNCHRCFYQICQYVSTFYLELYWF